MFCLPCVSCVSCRVQVAIGILILVAVYVLIVFELVHRAIAALVGSFWALAFLSAVEQRPSFDDVHDQPHAPHTPHTRYGVTRVIVQRRQVVSWIDFETIVFLFGMMTLVGIFSETGFFEWSAIRAYKLSGGNIWHLVVMLVPLLSFSPRSFFLSLTSVRAGGGGGQVVFSGVTSSVLDNVTEVLLVVPVTLRLCKVIDVDPLPVVIAIVVRHRPFMKFFSDGRKIIIIIITIKLSCRVVSCRVVCRVSCADIQ